MSTRHGEWHLLERDGDPVPGDPIAVGDEARHYAEVSRTISAQAGRLRSLAEPDAALKGYYADELQNGMNDLADNLDKMHGRFEVAGSQLALLGPALESARSKTKTALDDAVEAQKVIDANQPGEPPVPGSPPPTEAEKHAESTRSTAHGNGEHALSAARTACNTAMNAFNDVAGTVAQKIKSASDDDMKDSRWDKFKGFVSKIAPVLRIIAKILTYAALVLAFFVAPWVLALILLGSLLINTLLAVTDNGSWVDVAFDVVGLLTLGLGTAALSMARAGRAVTLARAARPAAQAARSEAFAANAWNGGRGFLGFVSRFRPGVRSAMSSAYADEIVRVTSRPLAESASGLKSLVRGGMDPAVAGMVDDLRGIRVDFPGVNVAVRHVFGVDVAQSSAVVNLSATAFQTGGDVIDAGKFIFSKVTGQ